MNGQCCHSRCLHSNISLGMKQNKLKQTSKDKAQTTVIETDKLTHTVVFKKPSEIQRILGLWLFFLRGLPASNGR